MTEDIKAAELIERLQATLAKQSTPLPGEMIGSALLHKSIRDVAKAMQEIIDTVKRMREASVTAAEYQALRLRQLQQLNTLDEIVAKELRLNPALNKTVCL